MKFLHSVDHTGNTIVRPGWVVKTVSESYDIDAATDEIVLCNAASGELLIGLHTAVGHTGRSYTIKKVDATSNPVTVFTALSQTIDGNTQQKLRNRSALKIVSDGSNWQVI